MPRTRPLLVAVLGVLALVTMIVLTGSPGSTQAKWVDTAQVTTPGLEMGRVELGIGATSTGRSPTTTLTNSSGFDLEYAPGTATLTARPGTPTTAADASTYAGMSSIAYYTGTANCAASAATPRWSTGRSTSAQKAVSGSPARAPLADDASQQLCAAVRSGASTKDLLLRSAGRQFQLGTSVQAVSAGPGSWSTTIPWTVNHTVPFPAPAWKSCAGGTDALTLQWAWPDDATTTAPGNSTTHPAPAISRWELLVWNDRTGRWVRFGEAGHQIRWNRFPTADVSGFTWRNQTSYYITVRAYPFAGNNNYYVTSPEAYYVTRSGSTYTCRGLSGGSPVPTTAGYGPGELG